MMHRLRKGAFLFTLAFLYSVDASALTPIEQLYIKAERETDPGAAIEHWRALLPEADKGVLGKGVTRDDVQTNLIQSLLKKALADNNPAILSEALQNSTQIKDAQRRSWVEIVIGRHFAMLGNPNQGLAIFERVRKSADSTPEPQRTLLLGGIVKSLTIQENGTPLFGETGMIQAKTLAMEVKDPEAYASIMQASATADSKVNPQDAIAMLEAANNLLKEGNLAAALQSVMAVPLDFTDDRNKVLQGIVDEAVKQDDWGIAQQALRGVLDTMNQSDAMLKVVEKLIDEKETSRAFEIAGIIPDGRRASRAYALVGKSYSELDYTQRTEDALGKAWKAANTVKEDNRRQEAFADLATLFADMKRVEWAEKALSQVSSDQAAYKANASLAKVLADRKKLDEALEHFDQVEDASVDIRTNAAAAIAALMAEKGQPEKAQDILDDEGYKGDNVDQARFDIVEAFASAGEFSDADEAVEGIKSPAVAARASALVASHRSRNGEKEEGGLLMEKVLMSIGTLPEKDRAETKAFIAGLFIDEGQEAPASKLLANVPVEMQKHVFEKQSLLAVRDNQPERVPGILAPLKNTPAYDDVVAKVAVEMSRQRQIEPAIRLTQTMKDAIRRVLVFHDVAVIQAKHTDYYGILGKKETELLNSEIQPASIEGGKLSRAQIQESQKKLLSMVASKDSDILAMEMADSAMGRAIPVVDLGKIGVTHKDVKKRLPPVQHGVVKRLLADQSVFNTKFVVAIGASGFALAQQSSLPQIIYVQSGVVDLPTIYDQMMNEGQHDFIQKKGRTYLLRRPIVVGPEATFVVSGADVDELKMSEEAASYIVNAGNLYIVDTKVTSWSEKNNKPSWRVYDQKKIYRPYITSWSQSKTYMATTVFTALGYSNSKSYGISITSGPKEYVRYRYDRLARPEAVIVDNSFDNLLYGFYSYEADNVVLVGNEYINNTVYGIDPHDRSRWFTIAYNTAYTAEKKHGIIISREVNDSTILGNVSYDNHGSGIMVDRQSSGTLIYANTAFDNGQDGLTIFESSCKIIASNQFFENKRSGVKIRNSMDIGVYFNNIRENTSSAIHGYVADLRNDPAHAHRDFELDPYSDVTALSVVGNWIEKNGSGLYTDGMSALFVRKNRFVDQSPKIFRGNWSNDLPRIVARHDIDRKGLLITSRCPTGTLLPHHCSFRDDGIFNGDGQGDLAVRLKDEGCQDSVAKAGE